MAIRDGLEEIVPSINKRTRHWLHAHLKANPDSLFTRSLKKLRGLETTAFDLTPEWYTHSLPSKVRAWRDAYFLHNSDLSWMSASNPRQLAWILDELSRIIPAIDIDPSPPADFFNACRPYIPDPASTPPLQRYDIAIATIDAWPIPYGQKRETLGVMKRRWESGQARWRQTKWLSEDDLEQLNWAVDYVRKSELWTKYGITFSCWYSDEPKDKLTYVLGFLDHLHNISEETQELFIAKMRKTWSQKKYRESEKAKKQVYFSLSDEARRNLDQLEAAQKVTKNRIIEDLLAKAVESDDPR